MNGRTQAISKAVYKKSKNMKAVCMNFSNMALTNLQSLKAENSIKGINHFQYIE